MYTDYSRIHILDNICQLFSTDVVVVIVVLVVVSSQSMFSFSHTYFTTRAPWTETKNRAHNYCAIHTSTCSVYECCKCVCVLVRSLGNYDHRLQNNECPPPLRSPLWCHWSCFWFSVVAATAAVTTVNYRRHRFPSPAHCIITTLYFISYSIPCYGADWWLLSVLYYFFFFIYIFSLPAFPCCTSRHPPRTVYFIPAAACPYNIYIYIVSLRVFNDPHTLTTPWSPPNHCSNIPVRTPI